MANILPVLCRSEAFILFENNLNVDASVASDFATSSLCRYIGRFGRFAEPVAISRRGSRSYIMRRLPVRENLSRSQCKLPFWW